MECKQKLIKYSLSHLSLGFIIGNLSLAFKVNCYLEGSILKVFPQEFFGSMKFGGF
jgi:hypothetical protein